MNFIKRNLLSIVFLFSLIATTTISAQVINSEEITVNELKAHIGYLASEKLEGRRPGLNGAELAANYIREQFKGINLKPLTNNYFQYFNLISKLELGKNNYFKFENFNAELNKDFSPTSFSRKDSLTAEIVFVGFGLNINSEAIKWNDYKDVDVKNKWVLILRSNPDIPGKDFSQHSSLRKKILTAKDNGASGVIFANIASNSSENVFIKLNHRFPVYQIPVIQITKELADKILEKSDIIVDDLIEYYNSEQTPYSLNTGINLSAATEVIEKKIKTENVVAKIEGADPQLKNEYIVIGAHYDHLGYGGPGSGSRQPDTNAIHFGADDNASGTAAIIELAERLNANKDKIKRSILVLSFSAEETGLNGSKFFTQNPLVDLKQIKFMFNFDMIGRFNPDSKKLTVGGTGTAKGIEEILKHKLPEKKIKLKMSKEGYGPSDHASFYVKDIPVLFFFTDLHTDYHTPKDTPDKINYVGEKLITDYAYDVITTVANLDSSLTFTEAGPKTPQPNSKRRYKVSLGIMPDVAGSSTNGLSVDAVIDGRPAKKAGMKKGDKIIAINGKKVSNIYDYMDRLSELKKGQTIDVDVIRKGVKITLKVTL